MGFIKRLKNQPVIPGTVALYWLGQAGFLIKTADDRLLVVDPYYTDSVYHKFRKENGYSFKRLSAPLIDPEDLIYDDIYISHEHEDHLDVEAFPQISRGGHTKVFCGQTCAKVLQSCDVSAEKIAVTQIGDTINRKGYSVRIIPANHSDLCPEAQGFLFDFGFTRIYYSGDTCYDEHIARSVKKYEPEICLLPINGAFGNMNVEEAFLFMEKIHGRILIPHHFWTFPLHLGNPLELVEMAAQTQEGKKFRIQMLTPGEAFLIGN